MLNLMFFSGAGRDVRHHEFHGLGGKDIDRLTHVNYSGTVDVVQRVTVETGNF